MEGVHRRREGDGRKETHQRRIVPTRQFVPRITSLKAP
jgi:hypothetical protein